jgi:hypothetical protein
MQDPNYIRPDLPTPLPSGVARLPRRRGYPVPWFVGWIGGEPEFRMADSEKLALAVRRSLCWVCGDPIVGLRAYLVGPMCAVNRTSAEPPSHVRCADWSARACPPRGARPPGRRSWPASTPASQPCASWPRRRATAPRRPSTPRSSARYACFRSKRRERLRGGSLP